MRLTIKTTDGVKLPAGKADHIEFDDDIPGFGIRLREGGSRSWVFQYRVGSKTRRMALGSARAVPVGKARDTAADLHARVRLGQDPAMDKAVARQNADNTLGALVEQYLEAKKSELRPRSFTELNRHLRKDAKPLHNIPVTAVSQRDVATLLADIAREKGNVTSNHTRAALAACLGWVIREGVRLPAGNVASYTNKREEKSRERVLSDGELKAVWAACLDDDYGAIIKLLMLTGQRANEIGALRFNVELHDEEIVLPPARTKNARAHIVPLSEPARAILAAFQGDEDRTHLFGRVDTGFRSWGREKARLDARIALAGTALPHWTQHDLRRTAATGMAGLGVAPHIIEAVLNHVSGHKGGVAGIYNRATYDKEKRAALNLWAAHLLAVVEGRAAVVVPLRA